MSKRNIRESLRDVSKRRRTTVPAPSQPSEHQSSELEDEEHGPKTSFTIAAEQDTPPSPTPDARVTRPSSDTSHADHHPTAASIQTPPAAHAVEASRLSSIAGNTSHGDGAEHTNPHVAIPGRVLSQTHEPFVDGQVEPRAPRVRPITSGDLGLRMLYDGTNRPSQPEAGDPVDIVAVHGMGAHPNDTWCQKIDSGDSPVYVNWLEDERFLPAVAPRARIMRYGYHSRWFGQDAIKTKLSDISQSFLVQLKACRKKDPKRPLILIGHSFGGLVILKTLVDAHMERKRWPDIYDSTVGLVFLGTPFRGTHDSLPQGEVLKRAQELFTDSPVYEENLEILRAGGESLVDVVDMYSRIARQSAVPRVACFYEQKESDVSRIVEKDHGKGPNIAPVILVNESSGTLDSNEKTDKYALPRTHFNIQKFGSPEEHEFIVLRSAIEEMIEEGPELVSSRAQCHPEPPKLPPTVPALSGNCLKSLAFPHMQARSHDVSRAFAGTCKWLLEHKTYRRWAACDRGLLWIRGKPGSGKSTLIKYAHNNHRAGDNALVLSFFFHDRGDKLQKTPLGFFRSLLHQILGQVPDALQDLIDTFEKRSKENGEPGKNWDWHQEELRVFFESSLPKVLKARSVWLFIDALDESGRDNAVKLVEGFKSLLKDLESHPAGLRQLRICFSCRHYPILDLDENAFKICTEDENQKDISTFVDGQLSSFQGSSTIPTLVTERAAGVFMWAHLVVKRVLDLDRDGYGLKKIEAEIYTIPQDLDKLYQQLIQNMEPSSVKLVQWICFAIRPLSVGEFPWAMVIDADCPYGSLRACQDAEDYVSGRERVKRRVLTLSKGLAEVSRTEVVQFIHQSVKDFFVEKGLLALDGSATATEAAGRAHFRFSKICIRYLVMEEISQSISYMEEEPPHLRYDEAFPFLRYATTSWVAHTQQWDARSISRDDPEDLLALLDWPSDDRIELWVRVYRIFPDNNSDLLYHGTRLVHVVSRYGVAGLLTTILQKADCVIGDIDTKDGFGYTPLSWAASNGHEAVVKLLLDTSKVDVDVDVKGQYGQTPLSRAAENGHEAVVKLLLDTAVVKLLLDTGKVDVNVKDEYNHTPLLWAAENGHKAVVKLLLDTSKVDIDVKDEYNHTPLLWAALNGHEAVVKLLLDTGKVDVDVKGQYGQTPLSRAAENGHEAVVKLLLDTGKVDVNVKDEYNHTPLLWAAKNGHKAVVELLLGTGKVDIDAEDEDGWTLLRLATERGHKAVVELLRSER
ncbi:ankyrin repeat domain-containing protein 17 [Cladorrhinum sp. PSN259]|nr:ankyrin repeat domain-containing protein 17 [Cladorrhinum sp. PSN259]